MSKAEPKKAYSFRFNQHTNNQLTTLAAMYHMDRTEVLEYMISVWAEMWVEKKTEDNGDK